MLEGRTSNDSLPLMRMISRQWLWIFSLLLSAGQTALVNAQPSNGPATPPSGGPTIVQAPAQVPGHPSRPPLGSQSMPPGFWGPGAPPSPIDQAMESPVFKRILSLMEENMELKSELRIQAIQSEAREQLQNLKTETMMLREHLERTQEALKQATIAKESLEKRITELDHRSRLLEERAKSMVERQSELPSLERLTKFVNELQAAFDQQLQRMQPQARETRGKKSGKDRQESKSPTTEDSNE